MRQYYPKDYTLFYQLISLLGKKNSSLFMLTNFLLEYDISCCYLDMQQDGEIMNASKEKEKEKKKNSLFCHSVYVCNLSSLYSVYCSLDRPSLALNRLVFFHVLV